MTYELVTYPTITCKQTIATFPSYRDAKLYAYQWFNIFLFERDDAVAYDAADFITEEGAIYSIQPVTTQH